MTFAVMILERDPLQWADLPRSLMTWVQIAGGLASFSALIWFIDRMSKRRLGKRTQVVPTIALAALAVSWAGFLTVGLLYAGNYLSEDAWYDLLPSRIPVRSPLDTEPPIMPRLTLSDWILTVAGACSLAVVLAPITMAAATRFRWGRVWAIARLSLKEAVRSRVVLIFGGMALVFLFADWFVPYKPEDQVRNYVRVLYWSMFPLFFMTASVLGAFGIPTDVKTQSIHTIVTKPVEKFEIVLGRFLGYAVLVTLGLAAVTAVSMLYVFRGVTKEAEKESYTARVPIYGAMSYHGTKDNKGENAGRVFDVRGYITGPQAMAPNAPRQYGVWSYDSLPRDLGADGKPVRVEFGFDIFRLTKGVENQGVLCTFYFVDGRIPPSDFDRVGKKMKAEFDQLQDVARKEVGKKADAMQKEIDAIQQALLKKYGMFVKPGFNVTDYHTQVIEIPALLFEHLRQQEDAQPRDAGGETRIPMLHVAVTVDYDTRGQNQQLLGIARHDLYLLAAERSFFMNFIKGIIGMWCLMMLVLGIAVGCSTYLSGVISWLCTIFLVLAGLFVPDIRDVAENLSPGGGPVESAVRLVSRIPVAGQLDETPATSVITAADAFNRFLLRIVLYVIPDVTRYDLHPYVANGFDISWTQILLLDNIVPLLAYLIPWGILAFYLMRYREIANPM